MKTALPVPEEIRSFSHRLWFAGVLIGSLIAFAGIFHLRNEEIAARQTAGAELDAIANLKAEQILSWRNERLGEARFLLKARGVVEDIVAFAARPRDATARERLLGWLEPIKGGTRYESIRLYTPQGELLLTIPGLSDGDTTLPNELLVRTLASHEPIFTDLQRDPDGPGIHLDLLVAVRPPPETSATASSARAPVAVIVLRLDPQQFLFPLIQNWPLPSTTGENLLVRVDGEEIIYLNELRHQPGTALTLRRTPEALQLPRARETQVIAGTNEGLDYRGVAVLRSAKSIPGSPWTLVSKVDQAEIYAPLRSAALLNGALVLSLLLVVVFAGFFLWRQRYARYLQRGLVAEQERNALSERLALITRHANDAILLFDENRRIIEANERALVTYGRTLEEMRRLTAQDLRAPSAEAGIEADYTAALQPGGATFETNHRRKDGTEFPVEVSARMVVIDGRHHMLSIARDITERKRTEIALRHSEEKFSQILNTMAEGVALNEIIYDAQGVMTDYRIIEVNQSFYTVADYVPGQVVGNTATKLYGLSSDTIRSFWESHRDRNEIRQTEFYSPRNHRCYHVTTSPFRQGRFVTTFFDITARKQTEAALRESEEKYAKVFQRAPVLIVLSDLETGRCIEVNNEVLRLSGFTREEVIGRTSVELGWIPAEARTQLAKGVSQHGRVDDLEMIFRTKTGELLNGLINAESMLVGGRSCLLTVTVDITEQTRTEAALRESEEKFATAFRDSPVSMAIRDLESDVYLDVNDRCLEMMGYDRAEVVGRSPLEINWMDEADREANRVALSTSRNLTGRELRLRRKDGTPIICSYSTHVIPIGGRHCVLSTSLDITEQKRATNALRASEENYRRLFDTMLDGFALHEIICDAAGRPVDYRFLSVNPAFERMTGLRAADTVGRTVREIMPQTEPSWIERYGRVALTGEGVEFEEYSGALQKHFEIAAFQPNPGQFATVFIDITEQKRAETALRASEQRYRSILNASPDNLTIADLQGRILLVSPAGLTMFGYEQEEDVLRRPVVDFLIAEDRQIATERLGQMFQGIMPGVNEYRGLRRDGTVFDLEVNSKFVPDETGKPAQIIFVARDITVRKRTEEALAKATDRLNLATRAGGVGVWEYDVKENRLIWDDVMYQLYGISPDRFDGAYAAWKNGVHADDRARCDAEIQAALRAEKVFDTEFRVLWPDGSVRHIRALSLVKRDAAGNPLTMVGTNWDITAQKDAEKALQTSLREKEALLKEVHHRVKNNLQVITSLLRLEAGRSDLPATKSVLEDMQGRIRSMAMLHEALYRSGTFAAVDLGVYLKQITTQLFRALVPAPGVIQLHLDLSPVAVDMDQAMPCGLLLNELVSNALKHGFPAGRAGVVRVALHRVNGGPLLRLVVSDDGVGLPADAVSRPGRTLGLQLVGDLTRQIEGTLETGPGPGASFTITFTPRLSAAGLPAATPSTPS